MKTADVVVVGGGIAGLSVAARMAVHARVVVLEGESAPGYHASGRSVAFAHYGLGETVVQTLTALSMAELAAHGSKEAGRQIGAVVPVRPRVTTMSLSVSASPSRRVSSGTARGVVVASTRGA